jgi:Spy/CpxP family protein refolding chaperone
MKKIIAVLSLSFLIATVATAQDSTKEKKTKKERVKDMDSTQKADFKEKGLTMENLKELELTKDQQKKAEDIITNTRHEKEKIKSDASLTEAQKEEKLKAVEKDAKGKISEMLTPEQKEKIKNKKGKKKSEE